MMLLTYLYTPMKHVFVVGLHLYIDILTSIWRLMTLKPALVGQCQECLRGLIISCKCTFIYDFLCT